MSEWSSLIAIAIGLFIVFGWLSDRRSNRRQAKWSAEAEEHRTSADYVIQEQMEFEKRLNENDGLPDAVRGPELYIYRNLMCAWFNKLAAQSRYDEPKLKKIRKDWLVYMEMLESRRTSDFISLESHDEAKREKYGRIAQEERTQVKAIEDAFAEAVGP